MQSGICTVHCLRRRTSPRPYWIPLAAVDQNYKAEQRFGTSVRDSSPRYPLLPPRPRAFRAPPDRFRSICQTPSILFLHCSHPPPSCSSCSASFLADRHREFRETIGSTDSGGSGGAYRVSLSIHFVRGVPLEKGGTLALCFFYQPFCQLED